MGFNIIPKALLQNDPAVYGAISAFIFLATILYICSRSMGVPKFPLIGQNLGNIHRRRMYFGYHTLELFLEGYEKVLSVGEWLEPFH